jgi:rRNA maturation endonuclease Nob1
MKEALCINCGYILMEDDVDFCQDCGQELINNERR